MRAEGCNGARLNAKPLLDFVLDLDTKRMQTMQGDPCECHLSPSRTPHRSWRSLDEGPFHNLRPPQTMASKVAASSASLAADTLLPGSGAIFNALVGLANELKNSKEMCLELISKVNAVEPRIKELAESNEIKEKDALEKYKNLLKDIKAFLETHVKLNIMGRVTSHWKMKRRVDSFYLTLEDIKTLVGLDAMLEDAHRHSLVVYMLEQQQQLTEQTTRAISDEIKKLKSAVDSMPEEFALMLRTERVTLHDLADMKKELKYNDAAYSSEDNDTLLAVLDRMQKVLNIRAPHMSEWYISRTDIAFDNDSPFAASELREIYYGTTFTGAKVVVKAVKASPQNPTALALFNSEVKKWLDLRDPHILPLYGANNVSYPLLFVAGCAELGDYRSYLATRPYHVWQLFLDAARGLAYLHHKKIVHGNLKCSNLLVTAQGVGVVSDFGFAFVRKNPVLSAKPLPPTYNWQAPELHDRDSGTTSPRFESDIYSLGMCIYEALTGEAPYAELEKQQAIECITSGQLPVSQNDSQVSRDAWDLIRHMCTYEHDKRPNIDRVLGVLEFLAAREKAQHGCVRMSAPKSRFGQSQLRSLPSVEL